MLLQSEKPRVAKKADESKVQKGPVDPQGLAPSRGKKEDERVTARLGDQEEEGSGNGVFSEFLHQWAVSVSAAYRPPARGDGCTPSYDVGYLNGHVMQIDPVDECDPAIDDAFRAAITTAPRPPMPTSFGGRQITIRFYDTGRRPP